MEIYSPIIREAIDFAIKVHSLDEAQFRKGTKIPYISHPLGVGLILAKAGASDEIIVAGILHDTVEDASSEHKVTLEDITEKFGPVVARIVEDLSDNMVISWEERKNEEIAMIYKMANDSRLVRSADLVYNLRSSFKEYSEKGEDFFKAFNAPKAKQLQKYENIVAALEQTWPENPLLQELKTSLQDVKSAWS